MGRIKPKVLKSKTMEVMELHSDKFDTDFDKNKEVLKETMNIESKKLRNVMAGYISRLKKSGNY